MKNKKLIGIYKVGSSLREYHRDTNFAYTEVVNIIKLLKDYGHSVYVFKNRQDFYDFDDVADVTLDNLIVFNGPSPDNIFSEFKFLKMLIDISDQSVFVVTDLRICLTSSFHQLFDYVLTQSIAHIDFIDAKQKYNYMPESILYKAYDLFNGFEKDKMIVFGGTERNRLDDFTEYVWRPNVELYGRSKFYKFDDNRLPVDEYLDILKRTKYSIVIADKKYNDNNFITQRFFECLRYNVIPFVDEKYDQDNLTTLASDPRRVSNYREMMERINLLETTPEAYEKLLNFQQSRILERNVLDGKKVHDRLLLIN